LNKISRIFLFIITVFALSYSVIYAWGFTGHKKINRLAVMTLPSGIIGFYKRHIEFVTEHAVDPDKRRYGVEGEAERHYIDIDHYGKEPFKEMPRKWVDAVAKYTEDTLRAYGIVPWHIDEMMKKLTRAFKDENIDKILRYSSDLGHYVGDAHVPLHTTENYNGQLTNQKGIHGFWESRLVELFSEDYDFFIGRAEYIESPLDKAWEIVEASNAALDSVLSFEAKLNKEMPSDIKYAYETRGRVTIQTYSRDYSDAYHTMLNGMVERRMREAIITVGSMWYTAWVNAGKPDLNKLEGKDVSEETINELLKEEEAYQKGKIKGREHED
jgi:hypothetical protein